MQTFEMYEEKTCGNSWGFINLTKRFCAQICTAQYTSYIPLAPGVQPCSLGGSRCGST